MLLFSYTFCVVNEMSKSIKCGIWQIVLTHVFVRLCLISGAEFVPQHVRHLQFLPALKFFSTFLAVATV